MQFSNLQPAAYESRVLTNTPRGQRDFGAKLEKRVWALKYKVFGESMLTASYSSLCAYFKRNFFIFVVHLLVSRKWACLSLFLETI